MFNLSEAFTRARTTLIAYMSLSGTHCVRHVERGLMLLRKQKIPRYLP
jgi:hypothetical protein